MSKIKNLAYVISILGMHTAGLEYARDNILSSDTISRYEKLCLKWYNERIEECKEAVKILEKEAQE